LELNPMGNAECKTEVGRPLSCGDSKILLVRFVRIDFNTDVERARGLLLELSGLMVGIIDVGFVVEDLLQVHSD